MLKTWSELLEEGYSEMDIRKARIIVCHQCPRLLKSGHCELCGCSISSETARPNARCPIRKW